MVLVKVPENREAEMLEEFFMHSMFTFEGLDITHKKSLKALENDLYQFGYDKTKEVFAHVALGIIIVSVLPIVYEFAKAKMGKE